MSLFNQYLYESVHCIDLNIFYCCNIYMYKQKGRITSSSNISYGPMLQESVVKMHYITRFVLVRSNKLEYTRHVLPTTPTRFTAKASFAYQHS